MNSSTPELLRIQYFTIPAIFNCVCLCDHTICIDSLQTIHRCLWFIRFVGARTTQHFHSPFSKVNENMLPPILNGTKTVQTEHNGKIFFIVEVPPVFEWNSTLYFPITYTLESLCWIFWHSWSGREATKFKIWFWIFNSPTQSKNQIIHKLRCNSKNKVYLCPWFRVEK